MANLDNLNFQVILKSDEFEKQIKRVQALADEFNISMSAALSLTSAKEGAKNLAKIVSGLKQAKTAQKDLNDEIRKSPAEKITIKHGQAVKATNGKLYDTARILRTISTLTGGAFSVYGLRRFLSTLIEVTGQFEVQKMALRTMLQDIDAADKIFQDLYRFSSDSTYRFSELAKYSKQLAAFNIGKDSLLETTKMLGDVASGVGVSMDRIILAYGHVKSSGFLRGIQLRSFSQNGVPILDELAKMFTELEGHAVSLGEVFDKMTKREIPFEMVEEAFRRMTSEGGKFYQMQEVLSKTLAGQINILKGRWENLMYAIGQSQDTMLKGAVSSISNLIANYEDAGKFVRQLVVAFGIYKATLITLEIVTNTFTLANHKLLKSFVGIGKWIVANPYAALAAAIAAATFAIVRHTTALDNNERIQNALTKGQEDYNAAVGTEIAELDALYAKLKMTEKGTKDYDAAKRAIENRFGTYISQLQQEGVAVDNLANIYQNLTDKITEANKQRFLESTTEDITKEYGNTTKNIQKQLKGLIASMEKEAKRALTADEKEALWQYVAGTGDVVGVTGALLGMDDVLKKKTGGNEVGKNATSGPFYSAAQSAQANYEDQLDELRKQMKAATDTYTESMVDAQKAFETMSAKVVGPDGKEVTYELSKIVSDIKELDSEIEEIRKKAANGSITETEKKQLEALVQDREEQAKIYKSIMGVDYDKGVKAGETSAAKAEREREKEIRAEIQSLNKQASLIQKYKDVYETLLPYMGENTPSALENLFGRKFDDTDFDTQLDRLIVKLAELGEEGQIAAESLRAALGKDEASELKKSLEAQEKAAEILAAYLEKDFGIEGEGIAAKISKMLADLANKNLKSGQGLQKFIDELDKSEIAKKTEFIAGEKWGNFSKEWQEIAAETYWQKYRAEQIKAYKEKMKLELEANKKLTNEQIVGQADDLFRQLTGGLDLTNWNDKTITQLREIRAILASLTIPEDVLAMIEDEETRNRFIEAFNLLKSNETNKADKVIGEKSIHAAQRLLNIFQGIGAEITQMGDALGNDVLSGMGNILSLTEEVTGVITDNESLMRSLVQSGEDGMSEAVDDLTKSADWITMIVKLVLIVVKQFVNYFAQAKEEARAVTEALRESREIMFQKNLSQDVDSIFGKNFLQQLRNVRQELRQLNLDMGGTMGKFQGDAQGFFRKTGLFGMSKEYMTLAEAAGHLGIPVFDDYGNINAELLKLIQKTYKLDEYSDRLIQNLLEESEHYAEIVQTVDDMMEDIFGNVASSAADDIVKRWIEAGDAALDYADILDDVAQSYAKMIIQSTILDEVFDKAHIRALAAQFINGDYSGAMATIADDMQRIADMQPIYEEILKVFDPYFNKDGGENTLANGIKGITEDTASLLASYINAIRADVSMLRMLAQQGWTSVTHIASMLESLPTLNDYLANIAAHNANIEDNTRNILVELRGVIVNEGNGRGFRSYPA